MPNETEMALIAIFLIAGLIEVKQVMDEDPAVKENILVYEAYAAKSFPGDKLG